MSAIGIGTFSKIAHLYPNDDGTIVNERQGSALPDNGHRDEGIKKGGGGGV